MKSDFNGDGKADVLWQNTSGSRAIWLMNGTAREAGVAGTHATRLSESRPTGDFEGFCQQAAARGTGITIWIEWWM